MVKDLSKVRLVEIEIHSKCNRHCKWCPNSFINRTFKKELEENLFLKLLNDLKKYNFNGTITFSRYNEPMLDIELLSKRCKQVRDILPKCRLVFNTNGDYLTQENLNKIVIDDLTIMDYDNKGYTYWKNKLSLMQTIPDFEIDKTIQYPFHYVKYYTIPNILVFCDWTIHAGIGNRGGSLNIKKPIRTKKCLEPEYFIGVDYNGNVMPCCELRSDYNKHKPYILGNLNDNNINDIYYSEKAIKFRKRLFDFIDIPEVCKTCSKNGGRYTCDKPSIFYKDFKPNKTFKFSKEDELITEKYYKKICMGDEFADILWAKYKQSNNKKQIIKDNPSLLVFVDRVKNYYLKNRDFYEKEKKIKNSYNKFYKIKK